MLIGRPHLWQTIYAHVIANLRIPLPLRCGTGGTVCDGIFERDERRLRIFLNSASRPCFREMIATDWRLTAPRRSLWHRYGAHWVDFNSLRASFQ